MYFDAGDGMELRSGKTGATLQGALRSQTARNSEGDLAATKGLNNVYPVLSKLRNKAATTNNVNPMTGNKYVMTSNVSLRQ